MEISVCVFFISLITVPILLLTKLDWDDNQEITDKYVGITLLSIGGSLVLALYVYILITALALTLTATFILGIVPFIIFVHTHMKKRKSK